LEGVKAAGDGGFGAFRSAAALVAGAGR